MPLAVFVSFAAGVLLTLGVEESSRSGQKDLDEARGEIDAALENRTQGETDAARAKRLEDHLERLRAMLRGKEGANPR